MTAPAPDLTDLYRQIVLEHSRHPRNQRRPDGPVREGEGHNPLCGDKVQMAQPEASHATSASTSSWTVAYTRTLSPQRGRPPAAPSAPRRPP